MGVYTIEGYDGKKNKEIRTACELAAFMAFKRGEKTLIIDLFKPDYETPERMLRGKGTGEELRGEQNYNIADEGIDPMLRHAEASMLVKDDFDKFVYPILSAENKLDVATCTQNNNFISLLSSEVRFDALKRIVLSAKKIYDNIFLVLDTPESKFNEMLKAVKIEEKDLIDANIYCLKQSFSKKYEVTGRNVIFIVTDYEMESKHNIDNMRRDFIPMSLTTPSKKKMFKISHNIEEWDASIDGKLANFIFKNRNLNKDDPNYLWTKEQIDIMNALKGDKDSETNTAWESLEIIDENKVRLSDDYTEDRFNSKQQAYEASLAEDVTDILNGETISGEDMLEEKIYSKKKEKKAKKGGFFFGKKKKNEAAEEESDDTIENLEEFSEEEQVEGLSDKFSTEIPQEEIVEETEDLEDSDDTVSLDELVNNFGFASNDDTDEENELEEEAEENSIERVEIEDEDASGEEALPVEEILADDSDDDVFNSLNQVNKPKEETAEEKLARLEAENAAFRAEELAEESTEIEEAQEESIPAKTFVEGAVSIEEESTDEVTATEAAEEIIEEEVTDKFIVAGEVFDSVEDAAKKYDISVETVTKRMNLGWSIEKAFGID